MRDLADIEIIDLPEGAKITEPGFYRISIERHHSQPCDGVSVTSGILRKMELASPADVWETHLLNPDRTESKDSDALRLGRIMAAYIENGPEGVEEFVRVIASAPPSMTVPEMLELAINGHEVPKRPPNRPTFDQVQKYVSGKATPAAIHAVEYWLDIDRDPREIVNEKEWSTICDMGRALAADPAASAVMNGVPEISMAWKDEVTGLWCLARPDTVSFSGISTDYKRMSAQGGAFNARMVDARITLFGYDMQGAFACEGFQKLTGQWPDFGIIAQSDKAPHSVILREIADEDLQIGKFRNHRALNRFRECLDSGRWPGPGEVTGIYHRPDWQREMLLAEMQTAGCAPD